MRALPALLLVLLAVPAAAQAAYAPKLEVTVDPATPRSPSAITTVVTQAAGETASKSVRLLIPAGFQPSVQVQLTPCSDAQRDARACPPESQMGEAVARTSLGTFTGTVNYGVFDAEGLRFFVFLSNGIPLLDQTLEGHILPTNDGYLTTLDGLPDVATTSFRLALAGGERTLVATPRECGVYTLRAEFTSQRDEQATAEAPIEITGCANEAPRITSLRTKPRRRLVRFRLDEAASVAVEVRRAGRVVARRTRTGGPGTVTVRLPRLARGRYSVLLTATDDEGASTSRKVAYRVKRRR